MDLEKLKQAIVFAEKQSRLMEKSAKSERGSFAEHLTLCAEFLSIAAECMWKELELREGEGR